MDNRIDSSCWYKLYVPKVGWTEWRGGRLRMWAMNYEEFQSGPGNYPVAVVEDNKTMMCHSVLVEHVCFASVPPS